MLPFFEIMCGGQNPSSCNQRTYQERKLKFLKAMRDELEARLAGLNATISTIETQLNRDDIA
jgi:hypothetical protein